MKRRGPVVAVSIALVTALTIGAWALFNATNESVLPADPTAVYDPVLAGEELPTGYRQVLDRDQIEPIYHPEFTSASGVVWPADALVIGISSSETAKAYPVTHLNRHEMVIDSLDGEPLLVSW